ncbi:hypothetical protein PIB30_060165 [Stylosanthes scabra]|uniref:Uncharacterized protein n=1 Tax=Stylosanthes scabra TaxID=79078 RepID=A0ABU6WL73_9FABA|nr:hypothetical protein [Stylosanthes scabra]
MPMRLDSASDMPRREQTKPSIRIQCLGAQNSRQAPVLKYRRGKPDLAPEALKTHAQAPVFDAQAETDLRILLDPPFLEGTIPTLKWYYLIRCTCRIVAKRFAASSFWRRCRGEV